MLGPLVPSVFMGLKTTILELSESMLSDLQDMNTIRGGKNTIQCVNISTMLQMFVSTVKLNGEEKSKLLKITCADT